MQTIDDSDGFRRYANPFEGEPQRATVGIRKCFLDVRQVGGRLRVHEGSLQESDFLRGLPTGPTSLCLLLNTCLERAKVLADDAPNEHRVPHCPVLTESPLIVFEEADLLNVRQDPGTNDSCKNTADDGKDCQSPGTGPSLPLNHIAPKA